MASDSDFVDRDRIMYAGYGMILVGVYLVLLGGFTPGAMEIGGVGMALFIGGVIALNYSA